MYGGDEHMFVMLLTEKKFQTFTPKQICDAGKYTEVLVCLSLESRAKVDQMVAKAIAGGGSTYNEPQDHGFMYGHGFQDLDGHIWELVYMEPTEVKEPLRATNEETEDVSSFIQVLRWTPPDRESYGD
jgi:predicted lactoylglutathione lyase